MPQKDVRADMGLLWNTLTKSEWALIIKLMLCTVLATIFSWAIGDVYNPATAVTANLCLYVDRGYRGTLIYAVRRITAQIIQGALALLSRLLDYVDSVGRYRAWEPGAFTE